MAIDHSASAFAKPGPRKRKKNHVVRNKRRTKRGMVLDLDKVARLEIVFQRDQNICQRCGIEAAQSYFLKGSVMQAVIQWAHLHTREYLLTRWEPDNSLALCSRCHVWLDNHKVLGFDWFAKKYPERWERINRLLQARLLTEGHCKTSDAWVRSLWAERVQGERR